MDTDRAADGGGSNRVAVSGGVEMEAVLLKVVGEGTPGALAIDPPKLDLGDVKVRGDVCGALL